MLGVLANAGAVLVGGSVGLAFRGKINEKYTSALMAALALVSFGLGIICVVGTSDTLCLIICVAVGTLLGELIRIDDRVERLGQLAEKKLAGSDGGFAQAFVSCSILFCVGSMAVMGSVEAGINDNNSILYAKASSTSSPRWPSARVSARGSSPQPPASSSVRARSHSSPPP